MASRKALPGMRISAAPAINPLLVYNQHGDLERCALRSGNVHNAHNWRAVLDPAIQRYWWSGMSREDLRADAAFAMSRLFDYLEANGFGYATWLRADKVLEFVLPIFSSAYRSVHRT